MNWRQIGLFVCGLIFSLGLNLSLNLSLNLRGGSLGGDRLLAKEMPEIEELQETEKSSSIEELEIQLDRGNLSHLLKQGQIFHNFGSYRNAIKLWQSSLSSLAPAEQAIAYAQIAIAHNELGEWQAAIQNIETSLQLIDAPTVVQALPPSEHKLALAQILNVQGTLQLEHGKPDEAIATWQQAKQLYQEIDDPLGITIATINQAKALQAMGLYRRASNTLAQVQQLINQDLEQVNSQPADRHFETADLFDLSNSMRFNILLNLANGYRTVGNPAAAQQVLEQTFDLYGSLKLYGGDSIDLLPRILFGLGNVAQTQDHLDEALTYYNQIPATDHCVDLDGEDIDSASPYCLLALKASLEKVAIAMQQGQPAQATTMLSAIYAPLRQLPATRESVYAQVNWSEQAIVLLETTASDPEDLFTKAWIMLAQAQVQAKQLEDPKAIAYVLGNQAHLDEIQGNYTRAIATTEQALNLAQSSRSSEITYQWQWQLGRLYRQMGREPEAIAAYQGAIGTLQNLRYDLVAISADTQFSFRDQVEPVYRELVDLLIPNQIDSIAETTDPKNSTTPKLSAANTSNSDHTAIAKVKRSSTTTTQIEQNLIQARQIIEQLQLAELDNFFRQACIDAEFSSIETIDPYAAVVYPIITPTRLEVIVSIPDQPLFHYGTEVAPNEIDQAIDSMLVSLRQNSFASERLPIAKQLYDWLIRPAQADLEAARINTLVLVLDGEMRNIPMAALYDRESKQYLIEKYNLVLNQGLKLLKGRESLTGNNLRVVMAGISEAQGGFSELPAVNYELQQIAQQFTSSSFLNKSFTANKLKTAIAASDYPIIHLATHGRFSSNLSDTFILAWDDKINIDRLEQLLSPRQTMTSTPIELLVLSACETATGDRRAALGLAGVALRSGARSTLASLWTVADRSTAELMVQFYDELGKPNITKAEALRQAQLSLLKGKHGNEYKHPYYWAAFVLAGNWL
jgi:CHAT domain-containing protein